MARRAPEPPAADAPRGLPKGLGTLFERSLRYWLSLTERERLASTVGPPVAALLRIQQLDGVRPVTDYMVRKAPTIQTAQRNKEKAR